VKKKNIILISILLLGSFLRIRKIWNYPPLNADEAAIGYNAYSILKTGRGEHGNPWPLHFKSFGDYKPGGYFYLVLPFLAVFGLNTLAVRLPCLILSIITIYLIFKIFDLVWKDETLSLISALVLAVSPWHLHFSRGGWESNVAVFFLVLGTYLFYKFISDNSRLLFLFSVFSFIASMYVYHSARVIAPLLFFGLSVFNFKLLWSERKKLILPVGAGIIFVLPIIVSFLGGGASSRFSGVGIFADSGPLWRINELRAQHKNTEAVIPTVFHNRYLGYVLALVENYFSHFNGNFLFISGDEVPRSKVPGMGVMQIIELPLLILGFWVLMKKKNTNKSLPLLWLLIAPVASALTFQAPSALRSLSLVIPLTFLVGLGIRKLVSSIVKLESSLLRITSYLLLIIGYLWGISRWQDAYFTHYLQRFPKAWPREYKQAVLWMGERPDSQFTVVTGHDQPYILTAFYLKYPPLKMQKEIELTSPDEFGFSTVRKFGQFKFLDSPPEDGKLVKEFNQTKIYEN